MNNNLSKLINIVKTLRAPNGCDWDMEQTHKSLIPYLLEETYEVIEAINENNYESLKEELGDLLLHVIFQAELASEKNKFNIEDSIININKKLINRHPHVFNDNKDESYTKGNWELTKQKEKKRTSKPPKKTSPSPSIGLKKITKFDGGSRFSSFGFLLRKITIPKIVKKVRRSQIVI